MDTSMTEANPPLLMATRAMGKGDDYFLVFTKQEGSSIITVLAVIVRMVRKGGAHV